jgi:hypothetical protein
MQSQELLLQQPEPAPIQSIFNLKHKLILIYNREFFYVRRENIRQRK